MKFVKNTFIQFNYFTSALKGYLFLKKLIVMFCCVSIGQSFI